MSTRQQRQDWQDFRERHGATESQFTEKWIAMFGRKPKQFEFEQYRDQRTQLRAPLGRKKTLMSAVTVTKKYEWDMAHRLPRHEGKCRRLHGHRYVAEIDITGSVITAGAETGMVVDFYRVKQVMDATIGEWDHRTMLHDEDYIFEGATTSLIEMGVFRVPFMPTAENIALEVLRLLSAHFVVTRVRIYETPNGWAEVKA